MTVTTDDLTDLEARVRGGDALTRADADRMVACPDLVSVGMLGQAARARHSGDRVTFGRVCLVNGATTPAARGDAGEVRIAGTPSSVDEACEWVRGAVPFASGAPLTGFSAADLFALSGDDAGRLAGIARALREAGLEGVAEFAIDSGWSDDQMTTIGRAIVSGGLGVWRLIVNRARVAEKLDLVDRAASLGRELGARAFAPLARHDVPEAPSTGYDDVRAVAVASVLCRDIAAIQVDWPLYGPKLAQVAIIYGANDIDGVDTVDTLGLGHRRSPVEDIQRQIRAAGASPMERNGRYETAL